MSNRPEVLETIFGCFAAGLVVVPMNARLHPREMAYLVENSGARVLIHTPEFESPLDEHWASFPSVEHRVRVGCSGATSYDELVDSAHTLPAPVDVDGHRPVLALLHLRHDRPAQGRDLDPPHGAGLRHELPGRLLPDRARGRAAARRPPLARQRHRRAARGRARGDQRDLRSVQLLARRHLRRRRAAGCHPHRVHGADPDREVPGGLRPRALRPRYLEGCLLRRGADLRRAPQARGGDLRARLRPDLRSGRVPDHRDRAARRRAPRDGEERRPAPGLGRLDPHRRRGEDLRRERRGVPAGDTRRDRRSRRHRHGRLLERPRRHRRDAAGRMAAHRATSASSTRAATCSCWTAPRT